MSKKQNRDCGELEWYGSLFLKGGDDMPEEQNNKKKDKIYFSIIPDRLTQCTYTRVTKDKATGKERREVRRLTCTHQCILAKIVSFTWNGQPCLALSGWWSDYLGLKKRQVLSLLEDLQKGGYIESRGKTTARKIYPTEKTLELWRALSLKTGPADAENCINGKSANVKKCTSSSLADAGNCTSSSLTDAKNYTHISNGSSNREDSNSIRCSSACSHPKFFPPSLDEVKKYINEKGLSVDAEDFLEHYEERDWHDSNGNTVKNWELRARQWSKREKRWQTQRQGQAQQPTRHTKAELDQRNREQQEQIDADTARYQQRKLAEMQKGVATT